MFQKLTNNSTSSLMGRRHKDSIRRDPIHVDTRSTFNIIHVYVPVLGYQVYDVILRRNLHGYREVVLSFCGEENVDRFLWEGLIPGGCLADL